MKIQGYNIFLKKMNISGYKHFFKIYTNIKCLHSITLINREGQRPVQFALIRI